MIDIFYFDKKLKKGKINDLDKIKTKQIWIDITSMTKNERDLIKNSFNLHPVTAEDLYLSNVRIKVEEFPEYLFCIFYMIQKKKRMQMLEMDFVLAKRFLITNHKEEIASYTKLKKDTGRLERLFKKGNDFIFHKLLDIEVDNYSPVLEEVADAIESLEEKATKKAEPRLLTEILKLKRELTIVRKCVYQQRDKVSFLAKNEYKFISKKAIPYFRDIYDHTILVYDSIDSYREAVANTLDVYTSSVSNNLSEVMKTLSVIATISLPLTAISSIYGTNFKVLPGQNFIYGFWVMILVMILISLSMIYFFKRRGWFRRLK